MKKLMLFVLGLAAMQAQTITGTWQGTLKVGPNELRMVIKISLDDDKLKAVMYSIDQGGQPINASSFTKDGLTIKMGIAMINGKFEGKLSADANTITGTWSQGPGVLPLVLTRTTPATEWAIPEPPPPPKMMAADAKPSFEVATIKPSKPEEGFSITVNRSGMLSTSNTSLSDLLKFAYDLHLKQISGGPAWLETDKFTITAKPDVAGLPSMAQLKMMMQKLLAERFQLTFHREKKDLSVYAITVAKTGAKLAKSEGDPKGLPGFGGGGRGSFMARNASMEELASVLQAGMLVNNLDKPVVDQTGLAGKYDFSLKWTPDAAMAAGAGTAPPADADAPPDLFTAFIQQLGLRLESAKAPVDVIVIDKVEKPSAN